jgi:hypothetical protein
VSRIVKVIAEDDDGASVYSEHPSALAVLATGITLSANIKVKIVLFFI